MTIFKVILFIYSVIQLVQSDSINRKIIIDGNLDDWLDAQSYSDPQDNIDGTVYQQSPWFPLLKIPDCHDTVHINPSDIPKHIYNLNIDIIEFKVAPNDTYYRVVDGGVVGKTSIESGGFDDKNSSKPSAGTYYIITTINIDMNETTGYWLNGGGYYPTAPVFDRNFEIEFYNGTYNQDYYLDHAENNIGQTNYLKEENNFIIDSDLYGYYSKYVYWTHQPTQDEILRYLDGPYQLPYPYNQNYICFTKDNAP
jgi:hypothetical protein